MKTPSKGDYPPRRQQMKLRFSDGMEFDVSGRLHMIHRSDGWYVVGEGMLAAVNDPEDGARLIVGLRKGRRDR